MDPSTTILRVKRKRGTDPADALLLACKRIRPETTSQIAGETVPEPDDTEVENSVFKLVATVASQVWAAVKPRFLVGDVHNWLVLCKTLKSAVLVWLGSYLMYLMLN